MRCEVRTFLNGTPTAEGKMSTAIAHAVMTHVRAQFGALTPEPALPTFAQLDAAPKYTDYDLKFGDVANKARVMLKIIA